MQPLGNQASCSNYTNNIRHGVLLYIIYHIMHLKITRLQSWVFLE